jgi:hypothetical protein
VLVENSAESDPQRSDKIIGWGIVLALTDMRSDLDTSVHEKRLEREHLAQVAGYGFEAIELFATRNHFNYPDGVHFAPATVAHRNGLTLNSVHAPITDVFGDTAEASLERRW